MVQEVSYDYDKDQKTKRITTVTREQGVNNCHKVRRPSISQERGSRLSSFVVKRMFTRGDSSLSHTVALAPGSGALLHWERNKGLVRSSTQESC